jgi:hypothetical protein
MLSNKISAADRQIDEGRVSGKFPWIGVAVVLAVCLVSSAIIMEFLS